MGRGAAGLESPAWGGFDLGLTGFVMMNYRIALRQQHEQDGLTEMTPFGRAGIAYNA